MDVRNKDSEHSARDGDISYDLDALKVRSPSPHRTENTDTPRNTKDTPGKMDTLETLEEDVTVGSKVMEGQG